jgi:hypothetical protein
MKLSSETLEVLKNFASSNPAIIIHPGNVVRSRAPDKSWFAEATVPDSFEKKIVLYNFGGFLGVLSLFRNDPPELRFGDTHVEISDGRQRIDYTLGAESESLIAAAPDKTPPFPKPDFEFDVGIEDLQKALKAISVLGLSELAIEVKDERVLLRGADRKNKAKNVYSAVVAEAPGVADRVSYLLKDVLIMLPRNYRVGMHKTVTRWSAENLVYWTANAKED